MQNLIHVIYASRATDDFREWQIPDLLAQSRASNEARKLTGMLVYVGGAFFQILEGERSVVERLYDKIARDKRHSQVTQIIAEPVLDRTFDGWTMGFATVDPIEAGRIVGQNDFFSSASCVSRIDEGRAKTLLTALSKRRWQLERSGMHKALGRGG